MNPMLRQTKYISDGRAKMYFGRKNERTNERLLYSNVDSPLASRWVPAIEMGLVHPEHPPLLQKMKAKRGIIVCNLICIKSRSKRKAST